MKLRIKLLLISILLGLDLFSLSKTNPPPKLVKIIKKQTVFNKVNNNTTISELVSKYNNKDIKGIISIVNDSKFNYPIVKGTDNNFYLTHDYYKNYNKYGSIYLDYRVDLDSKKILIYGHSSQYTTTNFGNLEKYYDKEYYNNHKIITITTDSYKYTYEIFSIYIETSDFTYMNINFNTENDWYQHLINLKNKSIYQNDIKLTTKDHILIMQTCSTKEEYHNYKNKYLLIISRRINSEKT